MESAINQVYAEDSDRFLLLQVGGISQVDMQHDIIRLRSRLQLKAQADPSVRLVGSRIVARGHGIDKRKKARSLTSRFLQLFQKLCPLALEHGFQPLLGHISDTRSI